MVECSHPGFIDKVFAIFTEVCHSASTRRYCVGFFECLGGEEAWDKSQRAHLASLFLRDFHCSTEKAAVSMDAQDASALRASPSGCFMLNEPANAISLDGNEVVDDAEVVLRSIAEVHAA